MHNLIIFLTDIKNHLVIDENVKHIVQEIFDMYAYQEMSTVKIAEELNRRGIIPPRSIYEHGNN